MPQYKNPLHPDILLGQSSCYNALGCALTSTCNRYLLNQQCYYPNHLYNPGCMPPISFDLRGGNGQGVSLRILRGDTEIEGHQDKVFAQRPDIKNFNFRIMWPGYPLPEISKVYTMSTSDGTATRGDVAHFVARRIAIFMEQVERERLPCSQPAYRIAFENGITLDNIYLVSLENTFDNSWQAILVVQRR